MFLLGCAWLAAYVWVGEHLSFVLIAAMAVLQAPPDRWTRRETVLSTATSPANSV